MVGGVAFPVVPRTFVAMRSPKYQLRMSQDLYDKLQAAGSAAVREALQRTFGGSTAPAPSVDPVVPEQDGMVVPGSTARRAGSTRKGRAVVPDIDAVVPDRSPVVPKDGPTGDRFALMREEAERKRAAKQAIREALPPAIRGLVV